VQLRLFRGLVNRPLGSLGVIRMHVIALAIVLEEPETLFSAHGTRADVAQPVLALPHAWR
jgi:hypothetical protein